MAMAENGIDALPAVRVRPEKGEPRVLPEDGAGQAVKSGAAQPAVVKKGPIPAEKKTCAFQCGKTNCDTDDEDKEAYQRWAYPNGQGANCWPCERVWCTEFSHRYKNRREYQDLQSTDLAVLENHNSRRAAYLTRRQSGGTRGGSRDGIKRASLKQRQQHDLQLCPPPDDFWPYESYVQRFGDPAQNRKRGHVVRKVNGIRGVVVPGAERDGPWKLQRGFNSSILQDEDHDVDDAGEEVINRKFRELVSDKEEAHKAAAVGIMANLLSQCALETPGTKPPRAKKQRGKQQDDDADVDAPKPSKRASSVWGLCSDSESDPRPAEKRHTSKRFRSSGGAAKPAGAQLASSSGVASSGALASKAHDGNSSCASDGG